MLGTVLRVGVFSAVLLVLPGVARAQLTGQAAANVSVGATNNPLLVPDGDPSIGPDEFTSVRGVLQAAYTGRHLDQTLGYTYSAAFYANHPEADGQNHDVGWRLHAEPTGRVELRAQADATYAYVNSVNPLAATSALNPENTATVGFVPVPAGAASFYGLSAGAAGYLHLNARQLWSEYTTVSQIFPVKGDLTRSFSATQNIHAERPWGRSSLTADLILNYLDSDGLMAQDGVVLPPEQEGGAELVVGWKRELSATVVAAAGVGVLVSDSFRSNQIAVDPVGQASIRYQRGFGLAEAILSQASQIDLYLGQFLVTDSLTARAFLALDRLERFHFVGAGSAQHGSVITDGGLASAVDLLSADVGFSFRPLRYSLLASIDYNVEDQIGHMVAGSTFPNLHRQMVLLTLTGTFRSDTGLH